MSSNLIIKLAELESTAPVEEDELIFRDVYEELIKTIKDKVKENVRRDEETTYDAKDSKDCVQWKNTCFFINGGRGSGKSTLLRAVGKHLEDKNNPLPMYRLAAVDPTELAETESFFIHILSRISKELGKQDLRFTDYLDKKRPLEKANELFQKMAMGLKLLGQKNSQELYDLDAQFFLTESVEQCTSSSDLKGCFRELIGCLCEILKVKAFYITIDDADMNFNKCREILETIRTYMLTPRLAFIFAGDLKLYSLVIRAMQIGHFGQISLQYDEERRHQRRRLLDQLEEQYLIKMFPSDNRVNLSNFSATLKKNAQLNYHENKTEPLKDFLERCISAYTPQIARGRIINYLGGLTIRTALQLLKIWSKNTTGTIDSHNDRAIAKGLMLSFSSSLIKHEVNYVAISSDDYGVLLKNIVEILGDDTTMYAASLIPQDGSEDRDHVIFYLNAETVHQARSVDHKLRYLFRVFPAIRYPELRNYINKVADEKEWAALCTASADPAIRGSNKGKRYGNGVIRLLKEKYEGVAPYALSTYLKQLTDFTKNALANSDINAPSMELMYCLAINHSLCKVYEKKESLIYLSTYCFMALLEQCLSINLSDDEAEVKKKISKCITLCETMPVAFKNVGDNDKSDAPTDVIEPETEKGFTKLFKEIKENTKYNSVLDNIADAVYNWLKKKPAEYATNPSQMSRCWQGIMSRHESDTDSAALSSKDPDKIAQAGKLFNKYLAAITSSIDESLKNAEVTADAKEEKSGSFGSYLREFPLMAVLLNNDSSDDTTYSEMREWTNKVNIGAKVEPASSKKTVGRKKNGENNATSEK